MMSPFISENTAKNPVFSRHTLKSMPLLWVFLFVSIVCCAVMLSFISFKYEKTSMEIQRLKKQETLLLIERNKWQLEQQYMASTPEIARRANSQLHMYSPHVSETATMPDTGTMVLSPNTVYSTASEKAAQEVAQ